MTGATLRNGAAPLQEDGPASTPTIPRDLAQTFGLFADFQGAEKPLGVALKATETADGLFAVAIVTVSGRHLDLGPYEEEAVIAEWRKLGASSGLPLMIEHRDGRLETAFPQIGPLQLGEIRIRRRHGPLAGRRPRFLVRRKTGRLALRPAVYREREIAGGRGA